jgi:hypothetical protein
LAIDLVLLPGGFLIRTGGDQKVEQPADPQVEADGRAGVEEQEARSEL